MELFIQDPNYPKSYSLHEALIKESKDAIEAGGVYAFVSSDGVRLFLENESLESLLLNGKMTLLIGIDEITNYKTLIKLKELENKYNGNLRVLAFLNDIRSSLFHPKLCWFKKNNGGSLIIGSGNLTIKGLRKNREIFSIISLDNDKISNIINQWNEWIEHNKNLLKPIDDEEVIERAKLNKFTAISRVKKEGKDKNKDKSLSETLLEEIEKENIEVDDIEAWEYEETDKVLICEIPKNGNRLKQVNFDKKSFYDFFGADKSDKSKIVIFKALYKNGKIGETEERPSVAVASQNYRFELSALSGIMYPSEGKPIGIFVRVMTRMILYSIVMPKEEEYIKLKKFLYENSEIKREDRMKRLNTKMDLLKKECPKLSICKFE